jgi:hypothetical protein
MAPSLVTSPELASSRTRAMVVMARVRNSSRVVETRSTEVGR